MEGSLHKATARRLTAILVALVAAAALPSAAAAAPRYAAPPPTGTGTACSSGAPCDVEVAINQALAGDEVILTGGDYYSAASPLANPLVSTAANLNVHGAAGPRPRIFINTPINTAGLDLSGAGTSVRHLEVHQVASGSNQAALVLDGVEGADLVGRSIASDGKGCALLGNAVLTNSVCEATGASGTAIFPYRPSGSPATNNSIIRNVTAYAPAAGSGTGIWAISGTGADNNLTVVNTIAHGGVIAVNAVDSSGGTATITLSNSNFGFQSNNNISDNGTIVDGGGNQRFLTPLFAAAGNYHQRAGSPTIDAGVNSSLNGATDFDGNARTIGARTDIGADEFVPVPAKTGGGAGGAGGGAGQVRLAISRLSTLNRVFRVDSRGEVAKRRRAAKGTRFRFSLSAAGPVAFTIERRTRGRRVRGRCRRQTRSNRKRRRCVRYVVVKRFTRTGKAGANDVPFSGRVRIRGRARSLRTGRYRATLRLSGGGKRSAPARVTFRVVR